MSNLDTKMYSINKQLTLLHLGSCQGNRLLPLPPQCKAELVDELAYEEDVVLSNHRVQRTAQGPSTLKIVPEGKEICSQKGGREVFSSVCRKRYTTLPSQSVCRTHRLGTLQLLTASLSDTTGVLIEPPKY